MSQGMQVPGAVPLIDGRAAEETRRSAVMNTQMFIAEQTAAIFNPLALEIIQDHPIVGEDTLSEVTQLLNKAAGTSHLAATILADQLYMPRIRQHNLESTRDDDPQQ